MEFDIDPLFKKTSKKFDEGGASSLLLNTLSIGNKILLQIDSEGLVNKQQSKHIEFEGFIKKEEPKDDEMIDETEEAINRKQKELEQEL